MAVSLDAGSAAGLDSGGAGTSTSESGTGVVTVVSSTALLLASGVYQTNTAFVSGVTMSWNGVAMTPIGSINYTNGTAWFSTFLFGLINPTTGNQTLATTWTTAGDCLITAASFAGTATTVAAAVTNFQAFNQSCKAVAPQAPARIPTLSGDGAFLSLGDSIQNYTSTSKGTNLIQLSGAGVYNFGCGYALASAQPYNPQLIQFNGGSATADPSCMFVGARIVALANAGLDASIYARQQNGFLRPVHKGMIGWRGLTRLQAFPSAAVVVTTPDTPVPQQPYIFWPPALRSALSLYQQQDTAQDFSSSAVETNPHWQGRSWAPGWSPSPLLLQETADIPPAASFDTPPSSVSRSFPPQWTPLPQLHVAGADDIQADTPSAYNQPRTWVIAWNSRTFNPVATDIPAVTFDTPGSFATRMQPPAWSPLRSLMVQPPQDTSSSAIETNPQWGSRLWPPQWQVLPLLRTDTDTLAPFTQPETNTFFIPHPWPAQWVLFAPLHYQPPQDTSSSAVETNPQWAPRVWPTLWVPLQYLARAPATDVPFVQTADTPGSFVPRSLANQWFFPTLFKSAGEDMQGLSDVPTVFTPRPFPPLWAPSPALLQETPQDFSATAIETNTHYPPIHWPPQWNVQLFQNILRLGTAQDFSSTPPVITGRSRIYVFW